MAHKAPYTLCALKGKMTSSLVSKLAETVAAMGVKLSKFLHTYPDNKKEKCSGQIVECFVENSLTYAQRGTLFRFDRHACTK